MFKYLLLLSSVLIALCAAFFSVTGIAALFAGKYWTVLVMASSLELGKLVAASFLYRYWVTTAKPLKVYLTVGVTVLMLITSIGIYGYLSAGYAQVAATPQQSMNQISMLESREQTLLDNVNGWRQDNTAIEARRSQANSTLGSVLSGNTQLNQRSAFSNLRQEIADLDKQKTTNNQLIQKAQQEHDSLDAIRVGLMGEVNSSGKIGQFMYVAKALNVPLDSVVKWFVLILVFVFDPLAVSLILAYNAVVKQESKQKVNTVVSTKPFAELLSRMPPERQKAAARRAQEMLAQIDKEVPPPQLETPPAPVVEEPVVEPSPPVVASTEIPERDAWNNVDEIARRYQAGETLQEIADDYKCSLTKIASVLESKGIPRRQGTKAHKVALLPDEPPSKVEHVAPPAPPPTHAFSTTNEFPAK